MEMRKGLILVLASAALIPPLHLRAQIPQITEAVTTDFGTYEPPQLRVNPDARSYSVNPGLSNVENQIDFVLPPEAEQLLEEQSFFVINGRDPLYLGTQSAGTAYLNFEDVYTEAEVSDIPLFVTVDSMLHLFHRLFDHSLKTTEESFLAPEAALLAHELMDSLAEIHDTSSNEAVEEAARLAVCHLSVGLRLLEPDAEIPAWAESTVLEELTLIEGAAGRAKSPTFDAYWEDYTQYIPRGHYTSSEQLQRYFRAMMWYGRMTFAMRNMDEYGQLLGQRSDLTAAALLLTRQLMLEVDGRSAADRWQRIFQPTRFFVGEADDWYFGDYAQLATSVYGHDLDTLSPTQICDADSLQVFMDRAENELPPPRIRGNAPPGMRLFGQRFTPDSWYLSELVWDKVGSSDNPRSMPSVLDVMSVLGSARAEELQRLDGAEDFAHYEEQLMMLREDVQTGPVERWASTLYWNWIYTMAPLLRTWGEGYPPYMQSEFWPIRQLMSAAGTWTELRHDTILYAKQSNTSPWTSAPPVVEFTQGAVEPNPWVFARLAALADYAREGLEGLSILDPDVEERLTALSEGASLMSDAAIRELKQRPLRAEQYAFIRQFGSWLAVQLSIEDNGSMVEASNDDDCSPVVADVHTDPTSGQVLEEGAGYPARIFVVTDVEGRLFLCVGAVYSHFEFTQPMSERLTDEQWRVRLADEAPEPPWWTQDVLVNTAVPPADARVGTGEEYSRWTASVRLSKEHLCQGEDVEFQCEPMATRVRVYKDGLLVEDHEIPAGEGSYVSLPITQAPGHLTYVLELLYGIEYATRIEVMPRALRHELLWQAQ